ncbi:MAG: hypothetical protein ACLQBA_18400 [Candidatus Binataceae bacterium]
MSKLVAPDGSVRRHKPQLSGLHLLLTILTFSLIALPAAQAIAYPGGGTLPSVGSLDDYVRQTQPRDQGYAPPGSYMGSNMGQSGFYGGSTGSRSQMNPAVMGTMMIALWALQRYQERHQRHTARHYRRHYHSVGNPMQSPF